MESENILSRRCGRGKYEMCLSFDVKTNYSLVTKAEIPASMLR